MKTSKASEIDMGTLTFLPQSDKTNPASYLLEILDMPTRGTVRCNACKKQMVKTLCDCGLSTAHIVVYWNGRHHRFGRYYLDDEVMDNKRAMAQLFEMRREMKKKKFKPENWTPQKFKERKFEGQIARWLGHKKAEKSAGEFAPSTFRSYMSYNRAHFTFFEGKDVRNIGLEDLENFKDYLSKQSIKIKSRRNVLNALHAFFSWMHRKGIIDKIPTWPQIRGDDARPQVALDVEDQERGLAQLPERHRDIFAFEFETGLRPGEVCSLKVGDIDLDRRAALIQRTYSDTEIKPNTKANVKRHIPLSDTAIEIARRNMRGKLPEAFLFINAWTGKGYKPEVLRRAWRTHSGIPVTHYEASRHSFCTQIAEAGATDAEAQLLMRHQDRRSTARYTHLRPHKLRDLVNRRGKAEIVPLRNRRANESGPGDAE